MYDDTALERLQQIEKRLDDEWCTLESLLKENSHFLELAINHNVNYMLIDDKYEIDTSCFNN